MPSKLKYSILGISLAVILSLTSFAKKDYNVPSSFSLPSIPIEAQAAPVQQHQEINLSNAYIVSNKNNETIATTLPKYPTVDDTVNLNLVLEANQNGKKQYFSELSDIIVDGKKIQTDKISKWDSAKYGKLSINWFKVEPTQKNISNTDPVWHWEKVNYVETLFQKNAWTIKADVNPTYLTPQNNKGTMRFKAQVKYGNKSISTPGAESYGKIGIKDNVHRISVKGNTGNPIIDWAYSFMNQPYIWGSATPTGKSKDHQSEKYIGADCADLVVAAARKAGHNIEYGGSHNISPLNKRRDTEFISREPGLYTDGAYRKGKELVVIGPGNVKVGDIVLYNRHVGILSKDLPPKGILSENDLIIHTLFKEPIEEPISQAYSPPFSIVRFNK